MSDLLLAAACCGLGAADTFVELSPPSGTAPARTALVPVLIVTLSLGMRRLAPLATVATIVGAVVLPGLLFHVRLVYWGEFAPWLVALYSLGRHDTRRRAALGVLLAAVGFGALGFRYADLRAPGNALYDVGLMVVATAVGAVVQQRSGLRAANVQLEIDRRLAAERATADERSRIARELHDVISHGISVIVLQAGGARLGFDRDPESSREALRRIELAGRESLTELRLMLEVLRADDLAAAEGIDPLPTLRRLEDLIEEHRRLGLPVELRAPAGVDSVPLAIQLSAYRIVQEGLTNVLKHAAAAPTCVTLAVTDALGIEIRNGPGRGSSPVPGGGFGLLGLGERVAVLGGRLESGRTAEGGFRLYAEIPLHAEVA